MFIPAYSNELWRKQSKLPFSLAFRTVQCLEAAVRYSGVDVIGNMGPVRPRCHKVVHLTFASVVSWKEIVSKVKEARA